MKIATCLVEIGTQEVACQKSRSKGKIDVLTVLKLNKIQELYRTYFLCSTKN